MARLSLLLVMFGLVVMCGCATAMIVQAVSSQSSSSSSALNTISYTNRSFILGGEKKILLSGAIHYSRVPPSDWDSVFKTAKELGLNCIQTYVTWNQHEHVRGEVSWEGFGDLPRFIDLAAQNDLYVVVRIGPYICGEYYFGGLPVWLRSVDNISCFRCDDPIWEREMARWVKIVVDKITPQLYPNGGPVIMLQVENEYGPDDDYLRWAVDMARNITTAVPWNLCHDVSNCGDLNAGQDKVICTINGFWMETGGADGQPGPAFFESLWSKNPNQPAMWTEDQGWFDQWGVGQRIRWSADQIYGIARFFAYGGSYHNFYMLTGGNNYERKSGGEVVTAYAPDTVIDNLLLRHEPKFSFYQKFFQTIVAFSKDLLAYPPQTAIPLNGTVHSEKTQGLGDTSGDDLTLTLSTCYQYPEPHQTWSKKDLGNGFFSLSPQSNPTMCVTTDDLKAATLATCDGRDEQSWAINGKQLQSKIQKSCQRPDFKGKMCHVCFDSEGTKIDLWDCKSGSQASNQEFTISGTHIVSGGQCVIVGSSQPIVGSGAEAHVYGNLAFVSNYREFDSMTVEFKGHSLFLPNETVVMMNISDGKIWYNTSVVDPPNAKADASVASTDNNEVESIGIQNWEYVKEPVGYGSIAFGPRTSPEQLNITDNDSDYMWYKCNITGKGKVVVHGMGYGGMWYVYVDGVLFNTSSDTITHDGVHRIEILSVAMGLYNGGVGPSSVKGITSVEVGGVSTTVFETAWMLKGETMKAYNPSPSTAVAWQSIDGLKPTQELVWIRGTFDMPSSIPIMSGVNNSQPNQTAVVLDLSGMNKGVAYVNGFNIGRYYLIAGTCTGECAPPKHGEHCFIHWKACGEPTQHLYHIPFYLLKPTGNVVVLFEESVSLHPRDLGNVNVNILHAHPDRD